MHLSQAVIYQHTMIVVQFAPFKGFGVHLYHGARSHLFLGDLHQMPPDSREPYL
jgi:hypothetical protein